jgi:hypothetical protein
MAWTMYQAKAHAPIGSHISRSHASASLWIFTRQRSTRAWWTSLQIPATPSVALYEADRDNF